MTCCSLLCSESLVRNLDVNNFMFHVGCVIIIEFYAALLEHDTGAVAKVHVDGWL